MKAIKAQRSKHIRTDAWNAARGYHDDDDSIVKSVNNLK